MSWMTRGRLRQNCLVPERPLKLVRFGFIISTREESLTVTYKKDGRYIPEALAQLDYFLRDWRANGLASMSAETIDLMWELHEELGSKQPINIICGFRSAETNALLKRIGRHVASQSQHVLGRAIDMQFPDVPLEKLRNSALVRQAGGVGYYPSNGGGFIHIDSWSCTPLALD